MVDIGTLVLRRANVLFRQTGIVILSDTDKLDVMQADMERQKSSYERLTCEQLAERFPAFKAYGNTNTGALLDPTGGVLLANKCVDALKRTAEKRGAEILDSTRVVQVIPGSIVQVVTEGNDGTRRVYEANGLVLCAGAWAGDMLKQLNLSLPLTPVRMSVPYWRVNCSTDKEDFYPQR